MEPVATCLTCKWYIPVTMQDEYDCRHPDKIAERFVLADVPSAKGRRVSQGGPGEIEPIKNVDTRRDDSADKENYCGRYASAT